MLDMAVLLFAGFVTGYHLMLQKLLNLLGKLLEVRLNGRIRGKGNQAYFPLNTNWFQIKNRKPQNQVTNKLSIFLSS